MNQWDNLVKQPKTNLLSLAKRTSKEIPKLIVKRSPVDTGRFKSNWNSSLNEPNTTIDLESGAGITEIANKIKLGDTFYFVNPLVYGPKLEDGYSGQAPHGMVKITVAEFPLIVNEIAIDIINNPKSSDNK